MRILWAPRASSDLDEAFAYIANDSSESANRVADRIYQQILKLSELPYMGRIGVVPGTRELIFHPWPYIVVYRVDNDVIRILRIRHASQNWP